MTGTSYMHKIYGFLFILFLIPCHIIAQGEWNQWRFGWYAGLTFNSGIPVGVTGSALTQSSGGTSSTVSDSSGNLLFYSNGYEIWNKNDALMPNGSEILGGDECAQPVFCVPNATNHNQYYLFTVGAHNNNNQTLVGLHYSVVDMSLQGGLGDVVSGMKNVYIHYGDSAVNQLTGVRHANNKDVWIIVRKHKKQPEYLAYLITASGIDTTPVISSSSLPIHLQMVLGHLQDEGGGDLKISQDGTHLVCSDSLTEICNFNASTGVVTPQFLINPPGAFGAEFSVDSRYLYLCQVGSNGPQNNHSGWQFDLSYMDSLSFVQHQVLIGDGFGWKLQLGPDWKIYAGADPFIDSLHCINNPSLQGFACNYQKNAVSLTGENNSGLPQFLQKYKAYIHHSDLCQYDSVNFSGDIWPPADSIHWDFGDPTSGSDNFSNQATPSHIYSNVATYTITLFVRHIDNRTDTSWQSITILPGVDPELGPNRTVCIGDSTTFNAGACGGCTYQWKNLGTGLVVGTGQTYKTGSAGTYCVTVINSNNCSGSDTIQLFTSAVPSVTNNPLSESICSGNSTNISLTSSVPGTIFNWTASLTSGNITGFSADSGLVINQVLIDNLTTPGIVTYHITPKVGSCTGSTVDYQVTVTPGAPVSVAITASQNNVCAGTSITYTAVPTNGGANPAYQWKVDGTNSGTNSNTFTYTPVNNDIITCVLTSSITTCISNNPATSNAITMMVNPLQPVSVNVSPSQNPVCSGASVTFTATPTNGGTSPSYQWEVNGTGFGANSSTYTFIPINGDIVTCILTSDATCPTGNPATSNAVTMIVNSNQAVSVSISASSNPFCLGSSVTFTATPTNGGTSPSYQWKVNGTGVGTNNSTYTYVPNNNDVVTCDLNSSISCPISNPVTSNSITMTENTGLPAGVSITASANPFCPGALVTFTATPTNGGASPAYQWKVNGANAGPNSSTYSYHPNDGDSVRCFMTSNLSCVTNNPASSSDIIMNGTLAPTVTFTSCFDTVTTVNAKPIKLKGGIPLGGTYSGPGVNSLTGIFTPSAAGTGTKTITYTYTNVSSCSASKTIHIIVQATAVFSCGNMLTDIRDSKTYSTVQIGSQCWMASNLNYGTILVSTQDQRDNCLFEKYCYNDNPANCTNLGALYQWDELMQYDNTPADQGFCPPGWHIPTENDWNTLFANYINNGFAGNPLKYSGYSGFNALLSGENYFNKSWKYQGFATFFWSSTSHSPTQAWAHGMNEEDPSVSVYPASRGNAFSVRCIKD
jgi:uncharacterized protein (TIGR02145 family)